MAKASYPNTGLEIAIIGMSVRFPGADTLKKFWSNLKQGKESISFFSDHELYEAGIVDNFINHPQYVAAKGIVDDAMAFEPGLFGYNDREAMIMDPQMRIMHECVFQALNDAAIHADQFDGLMGLYGGVGTNFLWSEQFLSADKTNLSAGYEMMSLNAQEYFNSRVAHSLNLTGPAITIQTACSSSLVAIHTACQGLIAGDCDVAIAGGVQMKTDATLDHPEVFGYLYEEGMILSPDGHCRPFDASANGTVFSDGAGFVVLKRLDEAQADGDHIYSVIKATSVNNDGNDKVGFTAPSIQGQVQVISTAQQMAEIDPASIGFIEAHGTATTLGDPIEVKALSQVFKGNDKGSCYLGSVKSNLGHLGAAAGVAGLIKTSLSLYHGEIPATVNFVSSNPHTGIEETPFMVNAECIEWKNDEVALRAGVSSFGIGGTNAHAILEEYIKNPIGDIDSTPVKDVIETVMISATSQETLLQQVINLTEDLQNNPQFSLHDIAHTLNIGRPQLPYRAAYVAKSTPDLTNQLNQTNSHHIRETRKAPDHVVFMFPGQGSQYHGMFQQWYNSQPYFKKTVDDCFELLGPEKAQKLIDAIWGSRSDHTKINDTAVAQLSLFIFEYSLTKQLIHLGVNPTAMIGHSLGEYVAATISGVIDIQYALSLVTIRGQLMATTDSASMLMVNLPVRQLSGYLSAGKSLSIAAANSAHSCVVSGTVKDIQQMICELEEQSESFAQLPVNKAFHSAFMDPILDDYAKFIEPQKFNQPKIPFISNLSGVWYNPEISPKQYWVDHLRNTVQFDQGIKTILEQGDVLFVEVGPGKILSSLLKNNHSNSQFTGVIATGHHSKEDYSDEYCINKALAELALMGLDINWKEHNKHFIKRRISLPGLVFNRSIYNPIRSGEKIKKPSLTSQDMGLFYQKLWQMVPNKAKHDANHLISSGHHLLLLDDSSLSMSVRSNFDSISKSDYVSLIEHNNLAILNRVITEKIENILQPTTLNVLYINAYQGPETDLHLINEYFLKFIELMQLFKSQTQFQSINIHVINRDVHFITGQERINCVNAMLESLALVINQESPALQVYHYDLSNSDCKSNDKANNALTLLFKEMLSDRKKSSVAFRNGMRWEKSYHQIHQNPVDDTQISVIEGGHYCMTGGLGNIALLICDVMAHKCPLSLSLITRNNFPAEDEWQDHLNLYPDSKISVIINKLLAIKQLGSTIRILTADVSELSGLQQSVAQCEEVGGPINGVFHCAGNMQELTCASSKVTEQTLASHFHSKVIGTQNVKKVFEGDNVDFVVLMSSLSSIVGGLDMCSYAMANRYMDAYAEKQIVESSSTWVSVNWDAWDFSVDNTKLSDEIFMALSPNSGRKALKQMLHSLNAFQMIHCMGDLADRIDRSHSIGKETGSVNVTLRTTSREMKVNNPYVEANNHFEHILVEIWQERLAISGIGVEDNFFELGGDSLIAVSIFNSLKKHVDLDALGFSISDSFLYMTIKDMSNELINRLSVQKNDNQKELSSAAEEGEF